MFVVGLHLGIKCRKTAGYNEITIFVMLVFYELEKKIILEISIYRKLILI